MIMLSTLPLTISTNTITIVIMITFVVIFILTAILTLLSIPNWIKIEDTYKKTLFNSLILEVIGVIILVAAYAFGIKKNNNEEITSKDDKLVINNLGYTIGERDTILKSSYLQKIPSLKFNPDFSAEKTELNIESQDNVKIGKIGIDDLKQTGFFNSLGVFQASDYTNIRWKPNANGIWEIVKVDQKSLKERPTYSSEYLDNIRFDIYTISNGSDPQYRIIDNKDTIDHWTSDFSYRTRAPISYLTWRQNIITKAHECFHYIFLITGADFTSKKLSDHYVDVMQIRVSPLISPQVAKKQNI